MMSREICERLKEVETAVASLQEMLASAKKTRCGLTIEQWQRIIDEKYLVGASDKSIGVARQVKMITIYNLIELKTDINEDYPFVASANISWKYAAIPDIIGIRKPHFGGACPTKHEGRIVYKMKSGNWGDAESSADLFWKQECDNNDILEYIELP